MIADGGADAKDTRLELLPVEARPLRRTERNSSTSASTVVIVFGVNAVSPFSAMIRSRSVSGSHARMAFPVAVA